PSIRPRDSRVPRCTHRSCHASSWPSACHTTTSSPNSRTPTGRAGTANTWPAQATGCQSSTSTASSSMSGHASPLIGALARDTLRAMAAESVAGRLHTAEADVPVREGDYGDRVMAVEPGGIEFIALDERHGTPRRLFWTWN